MACGRGVMVCYMFYFEGRCSASHSSFPNIFNADFFNTYAEPKQPRRETTKQDKYF